MSKLIFYPKVQATKNDKFFLIESYKYNSVVIPKGFITNGADIPRVFWFVVHPFKPKFFPAVIIHDYLIKIATNKDEIIYANYYFEKILLQIENSLKTRIMIIAVKLYWKYVRKYDVK